MKLDLKKDLYSREKYLTKIRGFYHECEIIKVLTGVRRCGKSSIMNLIMQELLNQGNFTQTITFESGSFFCSFRLCNKFHSDSSVNQKYAKCNRLYGIERDWHDTHGKWCGIYC